MKYYVCEDCGYMINEKDYYYYEGDDHYRKTGHYNYRCEER